MEGWAQLITSLATLIAALGAFAINWRTSNRVVAVAGTVAAVASKVEEVHKATNGMTAKIVAITAVAENAKGNLEGRAELKAEQAETPLDKR